VTSRQIAARGLLACLALVASFEGLRTVAYLDPVGIPTICFGETKGVQLGDRVSRQQCEDMLAGRLIEFDTAVIRCLGYAPAPGPRTAFVSFAYNVGTEAFCTSTLARLAREGDIEGACAQLSRWVYAKGIKWPGLVRRRAEERRVCES